MPGRQATFRAWTRVWSRRMSSSSRADEYTTAGTRISPCFGISQTLSLIFRRSMASLTYRRRSGR